MTKKKLTQEEFDEIARSIRELGYELKLEAEVAKKRWINPYPPTLKVD